MIQKKLACFLTTAALCAGMTVPIRAGYSDLPENHWAYDSITRAAALSIMNGASDGRMSPENTLTWAHSLAIISRAFAAGDYWTATQVNGLHWATAAYQVARDNGFLGALSIPADDLQSPMTRQDMAVLLNAVLPAAGWESVEESAEETLSDFWQMDETHRQAVRRLFARGIVQGKNDGAFGPYDILRRSDGAVLLMRTLDYLDALNTGKEVTLTLALADASYTPMGETLTVKGYIGQSLNSLAARYAPESYKAISQAGTVSGAQSYYTLRYTPMTQNEIRQLSYLGDNSVKRAFLFGDANMTRYANETDARANMITVQVPVWDINSAGEKIPNTTRVTVHSALAQDLIAIFNEIYQDPEQFPFHSVGAYSWRGDTSTSEHCSGTAIDLNPEENFSIRYGEIQAGSYWAPGEDPYSIPENSSVVRIFAAHGWAWGGNAWAGGQTDQTQGYHDYMHFSYRGR